MRSLKITDTSEKTSAKIPLITVAIIASALSTVGRASEYKASDYYQVKLGLNYACVIADEGLKCWGKKVAFQGLKPDENLANVPAQIKKPMSVAIGSEVACAVDYDIGLKCWGRQSTAALAFNQLDPSNVIMLGGAKLTATDKPWKVTSSDYTACAIFKNTLEPGATKVGCWGRAADKVVIGGSAERDIGNPAQAEEIALGFNKEAGGGFDTYFAPQLFIAGGNNIFSVSASSQHACHLKGTVENPEVFVPVEAGDCDGYKAWYQGDFRGFLGGLGDEHINNDLNFYDRARETAQKVVATTGMTCLKFENTLDALDDNFGVDCFASGKKFVNNRRLLLSKLRSLQYVVDFDASESNVCAIMKGKGLTCVTNDSILEHNPPQTSSFSQCNNLVDGGQKNLCICEAGIFATLSPNDEEQASAYREFDESNDHPSKWRFDSKSKKEEQAYTKIYQDTLNTQLANLFTLTPVKHPYPTKLNCQFFSTAYRIEKDMPKVSFSGL